MSLLRTLDPSALRARVTGRSWWRVRYADGTVINEWDGPDWSLLPRRGLVAVRLCNSVDASDRLFQLKCGVRAVGRAKTEALAHLIGIVHGINGESHCAAWEPDPGRLVHFEDNVFQMSYQGIGRLSADHLGIRPD
jgi:hypothetical protein